jgi:hypothetical protein
LRIFEKRRHFYIYNVFFIAPCTKAPGGQPKKAELFVGQIGEAKKTCFAFFAPGKESQRAGFVVGEFGGGALAFEEAQAVFVKDEEASWLVALSRWFHGKASCQWMAEWCAFLLARAID